MTRIVGGDTDRVKRRGNRIADYTPIAISCTGSSWKDPSDPSAVTVMPTTCYRNDGLRCASSTSKCVSLAQNGEACAGSTDCTTALYCKSSRCTPREALGAACTRTSAGCVAGAYCDPQSLTCVPALPDGGACSDSGMCLSVHLARQARGLSPSGIAVYDEAPATPV